MMMMDTGALIPVLARSGSVLKIPSWLFFWAKYFGSGVIVATAFIHVSTFKVWVKGLC